MAEDRESYIERNKGLSLSDVLRQEQDDALDRVSAIRVNKAPKAKSVKPYTDGQRPVIDKDWVVSRFMVPNNELEPVDRINRMFSSANWKYTSTMLGSNLAINARPQFTRFADIKGNNANSFVATLIRSENGDAAKARAAMFDRVRVPMVNYQHDYSNPVALTTKGLGMGRYYSDAIDDNATLIYMQFGVTRFNSLIDFFTRAISYEDSYIANYGRLPVGYSIGKAVGAYGMLCAFPMISISIWLLKGVANLFLGGPFSYYYMEPAMHMYWTTVSEIVSNMATELGIIAPMLRNGTKADANKIGVPITMDPEDIQELAKMLPPGMINPDTGYIDIYAIATRTQALANAQTRLEYEAYKRDDEAVSKDMTGYVADYQKEGIKRLIGKSKFSYLNEMLMLENYVNDKNKKSLLERLSRGSGWFADRITDIPGQGPDDNQPAPKSDINDNSSTENRMSANPQDGTYPNVPLKDKEEQTAYMEKMATAIDSVVRDGGDYAIFAVDYQGSVSESFSNSYSDIETQGMIKSVSQGARNIKFQLGGGNIAGETIKDIAGTIKNVMMGVADSVTFGLSNVISTILGGAYTTLPKKWDDSDISLTSVNYKISLVSPYGNPISQMQNIYIPLAMLLAGVMPLAAGKSSYTSPFLCSIFNKGVQNVKLGMITSLSITRGTDNLGWSKNKRPLGMEIDFTVTDFSPLMAAPVNPTIFSQFNLSLDDNSPFGNYIGLLCSRDIITQKYVRPKILMKMSRMLMSASRAASPYSLGMRIGSVLQGPIGLVNVDRKISGTQVNNIVNET